MVLTLLSTTLPNQLLGAVVTITAFNSLWSYWLFFLPKNKSLPNHTETKAPKQNTTPKSTQTVMGPEAPETVIHFLFT